MIRNYHVRFGKRFLCNKFKTKKRASINYPFLYLYLKLTGRFQYVLIIYKEIKFFFKYYLKLNLSNITFSFINNNNVKRFFYNSENTLFLFEKFLSKLIFNFSKLKFRCYIVFYYILFFNKKTCNKANFYLQKFKLIKIIVQNITEFLSFFSEKKLIFKQIMLLIKNTTNLNGMSRSPVYRLCFGYRIS
jgi:hypothetical protein